MFVVTADQIGSRTATDIAPELIRRLMNDTSNEFLLPPERTVGDEIQFACASASTLVNTALTLHRTRKWWIGIGIGTIERPLPRSTREGRGTAFLAAREAVERAKSEGSQGGRPRKDALRIAVEDMPSHNSATAAEQPITASVIEPILNLILRLRDERSDAGWEVYDLDAAGLTGTESAKRLGISASAVHQRMSAAAVKLERAAHPPLVTLFEQAAANSSENANSKDGKDADRD